MLGALRKSVKTGLSSPLTEDDLCLRSPVNFRRGHRSHRFPVPLAFYQMHPWRTTPSRQSNPIETSDLHPRPMLYQERLPPLSVAKSASRYCEHQERAEIMILGLRAQRAFSSTAANVFGLVRQRQPNCGSPVNGKKRLTVSQSRAQVLLDKHCSVSGLCPHSLDPNNDTIVSCRPGTNPRV